MRRRVGPRAISAAGILFLLVATSLTAAPPGASRQGAASAEAATASVSVPRWLRPSEGIYPDITGDRAVWLRVSIPLQRVFVMSGNRRLYTMVASTGLDNPPDDATPRGTYFIQRERGLWFYAPSEQEGARYWVSWKNHGEYLFHTVPMDRSGHIIENEARRLGRKASHGCIRLSVPDAKWIYQHIPYGTRVVIGD